MSKKNAAKKTLGQLGAEATAAMANVHKLLDKDAAKAASKKVVNAGSASNPFLVEIAEPKTKPPAKKSKPAAAEKPKASKPAKASKSKPAVGTHHNGAAFTTARPGVIATVLELLRAATAAKPLTKAVILAELVKRFPEREETKMQATLNMQIPAGLRTEKGLEVQKNDNGYWLPK